MKVVSSCHNEKEEALEWKLASPADLEIWRSFHCILNVLEFVGAIAEGSVLGVFAIAEPIVPALLHLEPDRSTKKKKGMVGRLTIKKSHPNDIQINA